MAVALNEHGLTAFHRDGFVVLPGVLNAVQCDEVAGFIRASLDPLTAPAEYEADVGYPGSPVDRTAEGGSTPRRLLYAYTRSQLLRNLALHPQVASVLKYLLRGRVLMSQCHHNCVMTKHPGYSSATLWHQDIRYWSFDRPELISAWFALAEEGFSNGALQAISGTHRMDIERGRFDAEMFLRPELPVNDALLKKARTIALKPGDVLLFHCRLFHAAGRNLTGETKLSPVFTYHREDNYPIPNTRSAAFPSIPLPD